MHDILSRRAFGRMALAAPIAAWAAMFGAATAAAARGRVVPAGRASMRLPWALGSFDPHRLDDAACAVFGTSLFDTLYARDASGTYSAALAEEAPVLQGRTLTVKLRAGLRTAKGRPFEAADAAFAIARARAADARPWLSEIPQPRVLQNTLIFDAVDTAKLTRVLSSPLIAMVPRGFNPDSPDGTGPFRLLRRSDGWVLLRNPQAAMGPAFLDEIVLREAADLSASLRAFESGQDDIGWLGMGLHEPRPKAVPFDFGAVALAVFCIGRELPTWEAPGVAQSVCDGIPHGILAHLGLGAGSTQSGNGIKWSGAKVSLLVRDDSPWLADLARATANALSERDDAITVRAVSHEELRDRKRQRSFALAVDVVRPYASTLLGAYAALAASDEASTAAAKIARPPRLPEGASARTLTGLMRLGVMGEMRVAGGRIPELALAPALEGPGFDLGASQRLRKN